MHDDEIRAALRRGRIDDAFRRFVRAHGAAAFSASCRIVRDAQTAEDVMQESLISAFRRGLAFHLLVGGTSRRIVPAIPTDVLLVRAPA